MNAISLLNPKPSLEIVIQLKTITFPIGKIHPSSINAFELTGTRALYNPQRGLCSPAFEGAVSSRTMLPGFPSNAPSR